MENVKLVAINAAGSPVSVSIPDLKAYVLQVDEPEVPVVPELPVLFLGGGNSGIAKTSRTVELRSSYSDEVLGGEGRVGFFGSREQSPINLNGAFFSFDLLCPNLSGVRNTLIEFAFGLGDANGIMSKLSEHAYFSIKKEGNEVNDTVAYCLGIAGGSADPFEHVVFVDYPIAEKMSIIFYPGHIRVSTYFGSFKVDYPAGMHQYDHSQFNLVVSVSSFNESPLLKSINFGEGVTLPMSVLPPMPSTETF